MTIQPISAADTRPLRQRVLRPQQRADELVFPGDDAPGAAHFGAFDEGRLVGIASITPEPMPGRPAPGDWRLRGMATLPEVRGRGFGDALLARCFAHVAAAGGQRLWCNARSSALGFYLRHGLETHGDEFDLPGIGPHYLMSRAAAAPVGP